MDFSKLTLTELEDFLKINGVPILTYSERVYLSFNQIIEAKKRGLILSRDELDRRAEELFRELSQRNAQTFTLPVIDLYVAHQAKTQFRPGQLYNKDDVLKASPEVVNEFAKIFLTNDRQRIVRMLDWMELTQLTIEELIGVFEESRIWYLIPTTRAVDSEGTEDQLYRHVVQLSDWEATNYNVEVKGDNKYLTLRPEFDPLEIDDEFRGLPATRDNIRLAFAQDYPEISRYGALTIPRSFQDYVDLLVDGGRDAVEVIFQYDHLDPSDSRLLQHVVIV